MRAQKTQQEVFGVPGEGTDFVRGNMMTKPAASELFRIAIAEEPQVEVAEKLGVTQAMVSYLLSGKNRPGLDLAVKIQKHYGVDPSVWVSG